MTLVKDGHRAVANPVPSQSELEWLYSESWCEMLSDTVLLSKNLCLLKVLGLFHHLNCTYCWERISCLILVSNNSLSPCLTLALCTPDIFC